MGHTKGPFIYDVSHFGGRGGGSTKFLDLLTAGGGGHKIPDTLLQDGIK